MKSLMELMVELGFSPNAPASTQISFVKNLIRSANELRPDQKPGVNHEKEYKPEAAVVVLDEGPAQLSFDLNDGKRVS